MAGTGSSVVGQEGAPAAAHGVNLTDARKAISVSERQRFILRVRTMARAIAEAYYASREALGFPLLATTGKRADR